MTPAPLATSSPDLGGKAKNHSRRRADAETGEPRVLHLPHSHGTTAREPLFDLQFLMLTENSKLIFTHDLQILRRRKRSKKNPARPSAQGPCSRGEGCRQRFSRQSPGTTFRLTWPFDFFSAIPDPDVL